MSLSFNEFQRELLKQDIDPKLAYLFTLMYERFGELLAQQEEAARILITFANTLEKSVMMQQVDQRTLGEVAKRAGLIGKTPGVEVNSVANEGEWEE